MKVSHGATEFRFHVVRSLCAPAPLREQLRMSVQRHASLLVSVLPCDKKRRVSLRA
jgi:hypothetical protein